MYQKIDLSTDWEVLQDVHDSGEKLEIFQPEFHSTLISNQISEWERIDELKHLQLLFAPQPYYGRELRYFNEAPWWYRKTFFAPENVGHCILNFTNVDYYCKVWVNGRLLGEHEGYSAPFSFQLDEVLQRGKKNTIVVKVSSPWDRDVEGDMEELRTFFVLRNMVKGTYEHSDTFIQRDVNPIGIYGNVFLEIREDAGFHEPLRINYSLDTARLNVNGNVSTTISDLEPGQSYMARLTVADDTTKTVVFRTENDISFAGKLDLHFEFDRVRLWNIWDKGSPFLYTFCVELFCNGERISTADGKTGFRTVALERTPEKTQFVINGSPVFIRGTSYYPDVYLSSMSAERYQRDLLAIKTCGFNMIRVHVHVELPEFYALCDEMGIAVMQDSEYNWRHRYNESFTKRFIQVYLENVRMLMNHPSILTWVCMNEPGQLENVLTDGINTEELLESIPKDGNDKSPIMTTYFGPEIYAALTKEDSSRPVIKGSYCTNDLQSGDSHNYVGSLFGDKTHYSEIYGTTEKFNTEYGIDALPTLESLKKDVKIFQRLKKLQDNIDKIQHYQYSLLKYFTEHYRMQKYKPCSGYVQFLFCDIGPQSYYGLYDWWGMPKKGLQAILESNMPVGIFLKYGKDSLEGVYVVNDKIEDLQDCTVRWTIRNMDGRSIQANEAKVTIGGDSLLKVVDLTNYQAPYPGLSVSLALFAPNGDLLAKNDYEDVFEMPEHIEGHPSRMSHEYGVRLFWA